MTLKNDRVDDTVHLPYLIYYFDLLLKINSKNKV